MVYRWRLCKTSGQLTSIYYRTRTIEHESLIKKIALKVLSLTGFIALALICVFKIVNVLGFLMSAAQHVKNAYPNILQFSMLTISE